MAADGNNKPNLLTEALRGAGGGGGGSSRTPVEAPDSLNSIAHAHILDLWGEGEMAGWYSDHPFKDVALDETPIMNDDGSLNFTDIYMDWREGTQDQSYMKGFPSVANEVSVSTELKQINPWTQTINNIQLSAVRIRLSVLALSKTNASNGDINGHTVSYAIDLKVDGGAFVEVLANAITGKTNTKYERAHRLDLPPAMTSWTVRVRRLTADTDSASIQDTTMVESYTEIMDLKMRYPNSAYCGLRMDASQFRSIPSRAYRRLGRLMRVPSNYNPVDGTYAGIWDGTFMLAWTRNPAWIFYDLCTNERFGLGQYVDETQIDKWSLYQIAQYCDELVPDGKGGMEHRFTSTVYLQTQQEAYKVLQDLASVFRGMSYWGSGAIIPTCDMPRDPVYTYNNTNVKDGKFSYQGSARRARHTVALVSWSDPAFFNRQKVEYVEDEEGIARYGVQTVQITAVGCTSQGQAQRVGRWILLTEKMETDTVTFAVGLDGGMLSLPGQIINIADEKRAGRRIGGRVAAATTSAVTLDQLPIIAVADDLICILPTGIAQKRPVSSIVGNVVNVSPPFTAAPVPESVWAVESPTLKTQLYSVISIGEGEGLTAVITALQHEPGKHAAVDNGTKVEERTTTGMIDPAQKPPTDIVITQAPRAGMVIANTVVTATWTAAPGAINYDVQWRRSNGEWSPIQKVIGTEAELFNAFPGDYHCKVSARNGLGILSVPAISGTFVVDDQSLTPGFVDILNDSIADALETAENAQATADGTIDFHWQAAAPIIGAGVGEAKVGDFWVDTDDGNHLWRATGGVWVDAQDDEIGNALLAATTAQATADSKVKTYFAASAPVASAVGDLWFNTTTKKLLRWNGATWSDEIADVTLDQLGGSGVNLLPDEYSTFSVSTLPVNSPTGLSVSRDGATKKFQGSILLQRTGAGSEGYIYFGSANIPRTSGKKYLVSFYYLTNTMALGQLFLQDANGTTGHVEGGWLPVANGQWNRGYVLLDPATQGFTGSLMTLRLDVEGAAGVDVRYDGIMVEEMVGRALVPSTYSRGGAAGLALTAIANAATAQAAADGIVDIYRQSSAPAFPPAKLGDYWQDSDDGKWWYSTNGSSWTESTDSRVAQAILDAADANTNANTRIRTYYASTQPTPSAVGDLWYNTVSGILARWNGAAWVNTADNSIAAISPFVGNPGFEQELTNWTSYYGNSLAGYYTQGTAPLPPSGSKYLVKSQGTTGNTGLLNNSKIPVVAEGQAILIKGVFRSESAPAGGIQIGISWYDVNGSFLGGLNGVADFDQSYCAGAWKEYSKVCYAPKNAVFGLATILVLGYVSQAWMFDSIRADYLEDVSAGANMVQNSEFIQGTTSFLCQTAMTVSSQLENKFISMGALSAGSASILYQDMSQNIEPSIGKKISAQIEALATYTTDANTRAYLYVEFFSSGYAQQLGVAYSMPRSSAASEQPLTPNYWHRYRIDGVTVPANCAIIRVAFYCLGPTGAPWVRRMKLERGEVASAYTPSLDANTWGGELAYPGSGRRVGDQRNLVQSIVNSYGAVRNTAALTANSSGQITVNAHEARLGAITVSYSAVTNAVVGLTVGTRYVVYCTDPSYSGGVKTWSVAANPSAMMTLGDDKYVAGEITIPASGSGSGGAGGGGYECVEFDSVLPDGRYVRDLRPGIDQVLCVDINDNNRLEWITLEGLSIAEEECCRLVTEGLVEIEQSISTPMNLRNGNVTYTTHMLGKEVLVKRGNSDINDPSADDYRWEVVADVVRIGVKKVIRVNLGNRMFFAGKVPYATIATHNLPYKP